MLALGVNRCSDRHFEREGNGNVCLTANITEKAEILMFQLESLAIN